MGKQKQDLVGKVFSRLTVIRECADRNKFGHVMWECLCECGNSVNASTSSLNCKDRTSCGCRRKEIDEFGSREKHGATSAGEKTPEYMSWQSMKDRCTNPNANGYEHYGGRGIKVCDEWSDTKTGFINFLRDMGERLFGTTLDRINVNGNYEPTNCRWADNVTQANNKRHRKDSIYPGVTYNKANGNWRVRHFFNNKRTEVGQFDTLLDAVCAKITTIETTNSDCKQEI